MKFSRNSNPNILPSPIAISEYPEKSKYSCKVKNSAAAHLPANVTSLRLSRAVIAVSQQSAMSTFFTSPTEKRNIPSFSFSRLTCLSESCISISLYRTIGPATSCGKKETYRRSLKNDFCTSASPRYTSITYDIVWNVKKLIPMGMDSFTTGMVTLNMKLSVSVKNPRYL